MPALLQHSDFEGLVNETFAVTVEGREEAIEAELIEAELLNSQTAPGVERKPFALQFRLPPEAGLDQGTFKLRHERLEEVALFLVPISADESGWFMESCIN